MDGIDSERCGVGWQPLSQIPIEVYEILDFPHIFTLPESATATEKASAKGAFTNHDGVRPLRITSHETYSEETLFGEQATQWRTTLNEMPLKPAVHPRMMLSFLETDDERKESASSSRMNEAVVCSRIRTPSHEIRFSCILSRSFYFVATRAHTNGRRQ
jgi:hypothetical protein